MEIPIAFLKHGKLAAQRLALIFLGAVFFAAGYLKWDMDRTVQLYSIIRDLWPFVPARMAEQAALRLPPVEIALGIFVIIRRTRKWALWAMLSLLVIFLMFQATALSTGYQYSCGCFGTMKALAPENARFFWALHMAFTAAMITGVLVLAART